METFSMKKTVFQALIPKPHFQPAGDVAGMRHQQQVLMPMLVLALNEMLQDPQPQNVKKVLAVKPAIA